MHTGISTLANCVYSIYRPFVTMISEVEDVCHGDPIDVQVLLERAVTA